MDKWIGFRWASCSKKLNIPKKSTSLNFSLTFFLLPFKLNLLLDSHWMKSLLVSTLITACNSQAKQYFSQTIFESNVSVGFQFVHLQVFQFFIVVYEHTRYLGDFLLMNGCGCENSVIYLLSSFWCLMKKTLKIFMHFGDCLSDKVRK